jgi:hypothetical protein
LLAIDNTNLASIIKNNGVEIRQFQGLIATMDCLSFGTADYKPEAMSYEDEKLLTMCFVTNGGQFVE